MCTSVPHTPARRTLISTSSSRIVGRGTSRSTNPGPAVSFTSALTRASLSISRNVLRLGRGAIETKRIPDVDGSVMPRTMRVAGFLSMRRARFTIACIFACSYIRASFAALRAHSRAPHAPASRGYCVGSSRREFIRTTSVATAAIAGLAAVPSAARGALLAPRPASPAFGDDPDIEALAHLALDAARSAGAGYADVRFARNRTQSLFTRERRVQGLVDNQTQGFGIRALVNGAWGFAASRGLSRDEVTRVARQAVQQARANAATLVRPVVLAPATPVSRGEWHTPIEIDPFAVSIEDKVGALLAANAEALKAGARFVNSSMFFLREEKTFASTDGSYIVQTIYRTQPRVTVTAVSKDQSDFQTRSSNEIAPMGRGYEHVRDAKLLENAPRWATEAVQKLSAKPVEVGRYDLVLDPSHLWLTIHESVAHPTELDRALGFEEIGRA